MTQENEIVLPGTERWNYLVKQANVLIDKTSKYISKRNWHVGDAALEIHPINNKPGPSIHDTYVNLQRFADEISIGFDSILQYRNVSDKWKFNNRLLECTWTTHLVLTANQDLITPGLTKREAERLVAERNKPKPKDPEPKPEPKPNTKPDFKPDPEDFKPKPDKEPSLGDDYNPNSEPDFSDDQHFDNMRANLSGAVNKLNEAKAVWGHIRNPTKEMIAWVESRIFKVNEASNMLRDSIHVTEESLTSEISNLLGN